MNSVRPKLWTRDFIQLCLIGLLTSISMQLLNATISLYSDSIGATATFSGLISTGFALSAGVFRLVSGYLSDKIGRRLTMIIGAVIFMLCIEAFGLFAVPLALVIFRTLQGSGFSIVSTASGAAITDVTPRERLGEGIGFFSLGYTLAMAIGPLVGIPLARQGHFTLLYTITAGMIAIALVLTFFYKPKIAGKVNSGLVSSGLVSDTNPELDTQAAIPDKPTAPAASAPAGKPGRRLTDRLLALLLSIIETKALPASIGYMICCLASSCVIIFASLYATRQGFANVSLFFLLQAAAMFASRFFAGRLFDRRGSRVIIIPATLLGITAFLIIALTTSEIIFLLAGILYGLTFGMLMPVFNALSFKNVRPERRGAASATFYLFVDLGMGIGTVIGGRIIDVLSFQAMFLWAAICMFAALIYSLAMFRNKRTSRNEIIFTGGQNDG